MPRSAGAVRGNIPRWKRSSSFGAAELAKMAAVLEKFEGRGRSGSTVSARSLGSRHQAVSVPPNFKTLSTGCPTSARAASNLPSRPRDCFFFKDLKYMVFYSPVEYWIGFAFSPGRIEWIVLVEQRALFGLLTSASRFISDDSRARG